MKISIIDFHTISILLFHTLLTFIILDAYLPSLSPGLCARANLINIKCLQNYYKNALRIGSEVTSWNCKIIFNFTRARRRSIAPQTNWQYNGVCNFVITTLHLRAALSVFSRFPRDVHISLAVNLPDVTYEQPVSCFDTRIIYPLSRKRNVATERYDCNNECNRTRYIIVRRQRSVRVN